MTSWHQGDASSGSLTAGGSSIALDPATGDLTQSVVGFANLFEGIVVCAPPTGVASTDMANLATALGKLPASGGRLIVTGGTYKFNAGLTFDSAKQRISGSGTKFDFSGMSSGTAITIQGTDSGYNSAARGGIEGIEIAGPGKASSVTGVALVGASASSQNTINLLLPRTVIHDFHIGVSEGSHSWSIDWLDGSIYNCGTAIDDGASAADAGERMTYIGCNIFNNDLAMNFPWTGGGHHFIGCSFDFNPQLIALVGTHHCWLDECHVEYTASTTVPIQLSGTDPFFIMRGGSYSVHCQTTLTSGLASGVAVTTLPVVSVQVAVQAGDTILVSAGVNGVFDTFTASGSAAVGDTSIPVNSHAPTNSYSIGAKVYDSTRLPAAIVSNSAPIQNGAGAYFEHVVMGGISTTSGSFTSSGTQDQQCFVRPNLADGTCVNPTSNKNLTMPSGMRPGSSVLGALYTNVRNRTITGNVVIDPSLIGLESWTVTTGSALSVSMGGAAISGSTQTQEFRLIIYNNSGGALGVFTWPGSWFFPAGTPTLPANGKRIALRVFWDPVQAKYVALLDATDY